jgi:hypothetical protein
LKSVIGWCAAAGAALAFAFAMFLWGVMPASECSTRHEVHVWAGLVPFAMFVAAGGYVVVRGTVGQRLLLFLASAAVIPLYVATLSVSLQLVFETEIDCAAQGYR